MSNQELFFKADREVKIKDFTLSDLASYFLTFDKRVLNIETDDLEIKLLFTTDQLPHIIGMQYAYDNLKDSSEFKGVKGFEKLIQGRIQYDDFKKKLIKRNSTLPDRDRRTTWNDILSRIQHLPMFLNSLVKGEIRLVTLDSAKTQIKTKFKGEFLIFRIAHKKYLNMSIKKVDDHYVVESFFVNETIGYLGNQIEHDIKIVEWND